MKHHNVPGNHGQSDPTPPVVPLVPRDPAVVPAPDADPFAHLDLAYPSVPGGNFNSVIQAELEEAHHAKDHNIHDVNRADNDFARARVQKVLHGLRLVSDKSIEAKIDILEPYKRFQLPFARHHYYVGGVLTPGDAIDLPSYGGWGHGHHDIMYRAHEVDVAGWTFPFVLGGQSQAPKMIAQPVKNHTLIVAKDLAAGRFRSWIGGYEGIAPGQPTITNPSTKIATGNAISNGLRGGQHGDNAIDGMTRIDGPDTFRASTLKLWKIGSAVLARGAQLGIRDALELESMDPATRARFLSETPPALPPRPSDHVAPRPRHRY